MLTDYHLHLRPDEPDTPAERYFTGENVERYLAAAKAAGIEELGVSEHVYRFSQALELWRHPFWEEQAREDLDSYCEFVRTTPLRLGIECDFVPGAEDRTATLLEARDFDYVVGSVHFVGEAAVDHPGWDVWESKGDPEEVWGRYFEALAECARTGLFDVLAHPDLVKVWGGARPLPERDPRFFYEPAIEAIAESGIAVEISTAGLRKPVGELYPARAFAEMCVEAGAPFALSSDAHLPEEVGFGYEQALAYLGDLGVEEICVFEGRQRRLEPLPAPVAREFEVMSVGIGYDSHRFAEGRRLVLGGVEVPHERGLAGHSDADVLTHAVIDALLGAAGQGDIGTLFPDDEERWRDADSIDLLRTAVGTVSGRIVNIDATLVCEAPRIGSLRAEMERNPGRGHLGPGQRQGDQQRGHGLDRSRRGNRLHSGRFGGERIGFPVRWEWSGH